MKRDVTKDEALRRAAAYCSRSEHCTGEVRAKLMQWGLAAGDADDVVTPEGSRQAYKTLKSIGADVEYIEFPGCNHGSWNPAFNYPGFMDWLFAQKKKK